MRWSGHGDPRVQLGHDRCDEARVGPDNVWPRAKEVTDAVNAVWKKVFATDELAVPDGLRQMQDDAVGILGPQAAK
jgi:hypothetical protein